MSQLAIETKDLTFNYGNNTAVDNLSVKIEEGKLLALLGTNGAGKTTVIKILCGLLKAYSGNAWILGRDVRNRMQSIRELISVAPQETAVAPHLNIEENLRLIAGLYGLNKKLARDRTERLMSDLELSQTNKQARKLSGGYKRRLSLAMALIPDPKLLFLDEPTIGLDPQARRKLWGYIQKIRKEKTVVLTTHYLEEADHLADQIVIMDQGRVLKSGTINEIKADLSPISQIRIKGHPWSENLTQQLKKSGYQIQKENLSLMIWNERPDIYYIMELLKSNGVIIEEIEMTRPTLEKVFLKLTQKDI